MKKSGMKSACRSIAGKRGSFVVFLIFIFSAVLILMYTVIGLSKQTAIYQSCENLGMIWKESILGEYDSKLRSRYGLYGYYGNVAMVRQKLEMYAGYSFNDKQYIDMDDISVSIKDYCLSDPEIFSEQINNIMLSGWEPEVCSPKESNDYTNPSITSKWIIDGLPSVKNSGLKCSLTVTDRTLQTEYILKSFRDYVDCRDLNDTFFNNEIEYILTGKLNDAASKKGTYVKMIALRNGLNLAYLYSCDQKREAALLEAELLTPGPGAQITQGLILESWALLESKNDMEILYDGKQVPLYKSDSNWAITLKSVIESDFSSENVENDRNTKESKYVSPDVIEGIYYRDYLKMLLMSINDSKRVLRMMDLIQINMKLNNAGDFRIEDCYSGLEFSFRVNGFEHEFKGSYK